MSEPQISQEPKPAAQLTTKEIVLEVRDLRSAVSSNFTNNMSRRRWVSAPESARRCSRWSVASANCARNWAGERLRN